MKKSTAFVFRLSRKTKVVGTLMIFIEAFQAFFLFSILQPLNQFRLLTRFFKSELTPYKPLHLNQKYIHLILIF